MRDPLVYVLFLAAAAAGPTSLFIQVWEQNQCYLLASPTGQPGPAHSARSWCYLRNLSFACLQTHLLSPSVDGTRPLTL
jgi:hypothetical protein